MYQQNRTEDCSKVVSGQTFINCSSCSCRRLRSSSSSSSLPLDLRLMSAPKSTAKTTSHISPTARGSQGTGPPVLNASGRQSQQWSSTFVNNTWEKRACHQFSWFLETTGPVRQASPKCDSVRHASQQSDLLN